MIREAGREKEEWLEGGGMQEGRERQAGRRSEERE